MRDPGPEPHGRSGGTGLTTLAVPADRPADRAHPHRRRTPPATTLTRRSPDTSTRPPPPPAAGGGGAGGNVRGSGYLSENW
ncbi:hypothetical protein ATKI12_8301 [Kitasatospora sp. Ki12]